MKSMLQRIDPDELPALLTKLKEEQAISLFLIGSEVRFQRLTIKWPRQFKGQTIYQLTGSLSKLPSELFQLKQLQDLSIIALSLEDRHVIKISEHLAQLISLDLRSNLIADAGAEAIAEHLTQLTSLTLSSNLIGYTGTKAIAENLIWLDSLDLRRNYIDYASALTIAKQLYRITSLNLSGNQIGDAGAKAIAERLHRTTSLDLSGNQIGDAGAKAIAERLKWITSLDLSGNQIGDTGAKSIAERLTQLTSLNLGSNQIGVTSIRAFAKHLTQLTSLDLSRNRLRVASAKAIADGLTQLTSLNLSDNHIGDAGGQAIAERLTQLISLNLSGNNIGDGAVSAIGHYLTNLRTIDLKENKRITTITPLMDIQFSRLNIADTGVTDLSPLKSFIFSGYKIKWSNLPDESQEILVQRCHLKHPSPEIIQQGPEAVLNYFQEIEAQGTDRLFEAKLLIVGEGGAGKTSLLRRMFLPDASLPTEDESTRGIDIHHHDFTLPDGRIFRLNAWDFGGQQIYHATHQFFLTQRSLYVLVDDTRSDHRSIHDEGFKFWLEVIETLSESSPVLIFQNEKSGRSKQIDEAGIKGRFPNVQRVHRGNLEHPKSADILRQAVEHFAQQLPHIGDDVPAKWVTIRKDLEEKAATHAFISLDEYLKVYGRHLELNRHKALRLSHYFHDLGVFLHFQDSPILRKTVFLQNEWVTEAVFSILDDEKIKSQRGRFTLADSDRLWSEDGYDAKDVELRELMVKFELIYLLPDTQEETWLVPQHLSPSMPSKMKEWAKRGDLVLTYRYEFLPKGMVSRLMVRLHRLVKALDLCWSDGVLFEDEESQVLAQTTANGNEVKLRSRGPKRHELLSIIASDLDALNNSFQGLKDRVKKLVPCICDTCRDSTTPAMFDQKELIERKKIGKLTIECPRPPKYSNVSVIQLLEGMDLEKWFKAAKRPFSSDQKEKDVSTDEVDPSGAVDVKEEKIIRIFLASSLELSKDRDDFELYFRQQNDLLRKENIYLQIVRWENFLDAMSDTNSQDEYKKVIKQCDIFLSLFKTKTGKYTEEEFDVAHQTFQETGKPLIYTYFKKATVSTSDLNIEDLISLQNFKKKLGGFGHFYTEYESMEDLKRQFRDQLDMLKGDDKI